MPLPSEQPLKIEGSKKSLETKQYKHIVNACSFCKKRHLKCDGKEPCHQCVTRGREECLYPAPIRRGRKKKNSLVSSIKPNPEVKIQPISDNDDYNFLLADPTDFQIPEIDDESWNIFLNSEQNLSLDIFSNLEKEPELIKPQIIEPALNVSTYEILFELFKKHVLFIFDDFQISVTPNFDWNSWKNFSLDSANSIPAFTLQGMIDAYEFSLICALASRYYVNKGKDISNEFIKRSEKFSFRLFFVDMVAKKVTEVKFYMKYSEVE